jgi:hypothetical protein
MTHWQATLALVSYLTLLHRSLVKFYGLASELIKKRAIAIEAEVYKRHDYMVKGEYRTKMRSLFSNLKDKSNPGLRESVVSGALRVERLCSMTSQVRLFPRSVGLPAHRFRKWHPRKEKLPTRRSRKITSSIRWLLERLKLRPTRSSAGSASRQVVSTIPSE